MTHASTSSRNTRRRKKPQKPNDVDAPTVQRYLDASTGLITDSDRHLLGQYQESEFDRDISVARIVSHRFGWWVNVQWEDRAQFSLDLASFKRVGFSPDFTRAFKLAAAKKCCWINFDRDA